MKSERIDTRALLSGEPGDANYTHPRVRLAELKRVRDYFPEDILVPIRDGFVTAPPWRLLLDPTAWRDVRPEVVHAYFRECLRRGRWPELDSLRRRFGRVSNHRTPAENPVQEALL